MVPAVSEIRSAEASAQNVVHSRDDQNSYTTYWKIGEVRYLL